VTTADYITDDDLLLEYELRQRRRGAIAEDAGLIERTPTAWLSALYPQAVSKPMAPHHSRTWDWAWSIECGTKPRPYVLVLPRGGGKSTTVELIVIAVGATGRRKYGWYVSDTQDQADEHVSIIATKLESKALETYYPKMSQRRVGKYGNSKGWRRERLSCGNDFTIDALGLDTAARGKRIDDQRPDFIVFDDIDRHDDSPAATQKKILNITQKLLPAGAPDLAVIVIQNLILDTGIVGQLVNGSVDFLADRIVDGPHPALIGLEYEPYTREDNGLLSYQITHGTPVWDGQGILECQQYIHTFGLDAFLTECQHDTGRVKGGYYDDISFKRCNPDDVPWGQIENVQVWCDPAVTNTDKSDSHGINVDALARNGTIYRLRSWEDRADPVAVLQKAFLWALEFKASAVGIETNQGGDTWLSVADVAWRELVTTKVVAPDARRPNLLSAKAGADTGGKFERGSQMAAEYRMGRFVHVRGTHEVLEKALKRFPLSKPYDLADTAWWSWKGLMEGYGKTFAAAVGGSRNAFTQGRR